MKMIYANDLLKEIELHGTTNHNVMWTDGYHTAIYDVKCIIENMSHVGRETEVPTMNELKLRNCPFCDGKAELRIASEFLYGGGSVSIGGWQVRCTDCGIETHIENRDKAIEKWNRRSDKC